MKKWKWVIANGIVGTLCISSTIYAARSTVMQDGLFLGFGADYSSNSVTQDSWGEGISNIQTSTGANSNGVGEGSGAPFHSTDNAFAPSVQLGYFRHLADSPDLYGIKFTYKYLGATATNPDLYIPQLGHTTSSSGVTSPLFGYVIADSVQVRTNHELSLLAFIGRSFENKYVYIGLGPALFNLQSQNYYSIGYAEFEGVTIDVTGLVSYSSPSIWAWGGELQTGITYFISPTWFIDASYTYARTGNYTTSHHQNFTNRSAVGSTTYTTSGTIFTKDTLSVTNQSVMLSINKVFDL